MELRSVLDDLRQFVEDEHRANYERLNEIWEKPVNQKLESGESQQVRGVRKEGKNHLHVILGENESRFREGDMICLHLGEPTEKRHVQQGTIEAENENEWLVRVHQIDDDALHEVISGCYADPDTMDLKPFYDKALQEIAESKQGREIVLPLLANRLDTGRIFEDDYDDAANYAEDNGLNTQQADAVGKAVAAKYLACIQGPPGTGKTKVISLVAKLLVEQGQRVLMTSHTHMAINNALNKIAGENVPVIKVGAKGCTKGLDKSVKHYEYGDDWDKKPDSGYVIGATPFATCSARLGQYDFDTVIFDEASQITLPLAIMAMRKAKRFVFVGDHKQLPPVVLSASVLDDYSVFSRMISGNPDVSVMLSQTYRMCKALSSWPSQCYYSSRLVSAGPNAARTFKLPKKPQRFEEILSEKHPFVFIKSPKINARNVNKPEAELVVDIIETAIDAGLSADEIGVVTPYRSHAKALKSCLADRQGIFSSKAIVTDTVERMQGQEREMIIISLCSTNPQYISAIAGFFFQAERLNVAITRPQTKLVLVGPEISNTFLQESNDKALLKRVEEYRSLVGSGYKYI
ncbi:AAA family ATPase [Vibrio parahaemolyticus]|uniref:DEAD/DEAH box helicase n=1 Tax=Vibrio parahaemolyticus TaxID=670 RepID=UPI000471E17C|nr:AAA domain-containing protein [Vibrio parahaemolyticus]EJE4178462.1 AAA family ATPase [Vibrio parahaemolyticus]MCR9782134.1 AAA domain-containing protein [Vibrio parahaemolyticus]MQP57140.1 AAA family ATPase [Vibrio parahaemolyticus]MQY99417.1 AAA family ATPase [Vibrio parahaemolyticus]MQZ10838.1 AAA family ATPase [Vibrio parahaemolyticus]